MSRLNKALSIILILGLLATITAIIYLVVTSPAGERFTEFYIKGLKGKAGGYAGAIKAGEAASVILGIIYREHAEMNYSVEVVIGVAKNSEIRLISLNHEEKWEQLVSFIPQKVNDKQKVEFLLYENGQIDPCFWLHL